MKKTKMLSYGEVSTFCGQLSLLLSSGVTPLEALGYMRDDSMSPEGIEILKNIQKQLFQGESFYQALANTHIFPSYALEMIRLGEETGNLDLITRDLSEFYEQQLEIKSSIKNALAYPFIMILLMLSIIIILLTQILPIFNQVFVELGSELTGFAKHLLSIGVALQSISTIIFVIFIVLIIFGFICTKSSKLKHKIRHILQRSKLTKSFYLDISYSRFASCFSMVNASGVNIFVGLELIEKLLSNDVMNTKIQICRDSLLQNDFIYEALKKAEIFKPSQLRIIQIAFKSGNVDQEFKKISLYYEKKVLDKIQAILEAIEPTLVILFSLIVGIILLSVILPLIGVMSNIG